VLPLAALQVADQIDEILAQELYDYSTYEDPDFTGAAFGFGRPASETPWLGEPGVLSSGFHHGCSTFLEFLNSIKPWLA
jgi:hypothetical protein